MRVRCRDHIRPRVMNARMDGECGNVDRMVAFDDLAFLVYQDQVRHADVSEMQAERIDPEMIQPLRISRRNVPRNTFIETELGKKAEGGGQTFFAIAAFLLH